MAFDLTWEKITALTVAQAAAGTALSALGNGAFNVISADWKTVGGLAAGSAISNLLALIVAYRLPGKAATAAVSVQAAAHQFSVADADEARRR